MCLVLKRTVSLRRFFWLPTTYVLVEKKENYFSVTHSYMYHIHPYNHPMHITNFNLTATGKILSQAYMNASVLLNVLKELCKRDQMQGLPSIYSIFRINFNQFNNTGAKC